MNNEGRKRIDSVMKDIEGGAKLREEIDAMIEALNDKVEEYKSVFEDASSAIEELKDEEQEKFDNLSEGLQQSEKGQTIEATVSALETAYDAAQEAAEIEAFEFDFDADAIITSLDEAKYAG